jgi:hypothetical protein
LLPATGLKAVSAGLKVLVVLCRESGEQFDRFVLDRLREVRITRSGEVLDT